MRCKAPLLKNPKRRCRAKARINGLCIMHLYPRKKKQNRIHNLSSKCIDCSKPCSFAAKRCWKCYSKNRYSQ